jgi:hypothetical protein
MLKKTLAASLAVISMVTVAQAADFDSKYNSKQRTSDEVVSKKFNGCYGGASVGYSVGDHALGGDIDFKGKKIGEWGTELGAQGHSYGVQGGCDLSVGPKYFVGAFGNWNKAAIDSNHFIDLGLVGASYSAELDQYWSIGGRAGYKIDEDFGVYAMAGYRQYEGDETLAAYFGPLSGSITNNFDINGVFVGGGMEKYLTNNISWFAEGDYFFSTSSPNDNDHDIATFRTGLNVRFDWQ